MTLSDILTICVYFHYSGYHTFKRYYKDHVCKELKTAFGALVSYTRFTELMHEAAEPLALFAASRNSKNMRGIAFIDSTKLVVCHNLRIYSHKVFKGIAQRGKSSMGWFYKILPTENDVYLSSLMHFPAKVPLPAPGAPIKLIMFLDCSIAWPS